MANFSQLRGMLLEEAVLYLLRASGYKTVDTVNGDETLETHSAGLAVKGRGSKHQIDAIADFAVTPPFSHPQRLLLEAKCYNKPTGIEVARNAFGVLQDVEEYWVRLPASTIPKKRYHYQYAIASINGFSQDAQEYSYAHDIYLLALEKASYFQEVAEAIKAFSDNNIEIQLPRKKGWLYQLRTLIRDSLRAQTNLLPDEANETTRQLLARYLIACRNVRSGIIALLNGRFPVILIPNRGIHPHEIVEQDVRIFRGNENRGWFITDQTGNKLFSFDIPQELFDLYAIGGELDRRQAIAMKFENMGIIQLIIALNERVRIITLQLDPGWIDQLRQR